MLLLTLYIYKLLYLGIGSCVDIHNSNMYIITSTVNL